MTLSPVVVYLDFLVPLPDFGSLKSSLFDRV